MKNIILRILHMFDCRPVFFKRVRLTGIAQILLAVLLVGMALSPAQLALAAGTYTVNRADDIAPRGTGVTCITAASTDCTLREAVIKANANPGSTIQFAAALNGTPIVLTRIGNDANANAGDLDINASTNIIGNGSSNTIIQGAADASYTSSIGDKVFGINQDGTFNSLTVNFSGLTIRYGDNNIPNGDPTFAYTGGGVDVFQTGSGNVATFTDCVISFNRNRNSYGGGLNFDQGSGATGSLSLTNVTFDSNKTLGVTGGQSTGGALNIFGVNAVVTISNSTFTNNLTAPTTSGGGAIYFRPTTSMSLLIHNSDFNGNTSGGNGGGIYINIPAAGAAGSIVTIDQGTQIRNNVSGGVAGGSAGGSGIFIGSSNALTATPITLSKVTISGNHDGASATSHNGGGGILVQAANVTVQYSRIVSNTISGGTGTGLFKSIDTGTVTAANNWWGCSTGPGAAPCDTAVIAGGSSGTLTSAPYLRLLTTAVPSTISVGQTSAVTTSFATNSAGTDVSANIERLIGLPVTWSAVHGSFSGQQATIQSNGMATATFTQDNTCNNSSVTAQVDNGPASGGPNTASLTVQCPDLTAVKSNNVGGATALGNNWTWTVHVANGGLGFAAFTNGNTILTDNLPNSNINYGSASVANASGLSGTVNCNISSNDLTCIASGTVTLNATGAFDVQFTATPIAAGTFANPRGGGICAVDPNSNVPESTEGNNTCSNTVTVAPAANTYVDPGGTCAGHTPCFTSPQPALDNTAVNGTVTISGTNNIAASLISANGGVNNVTISGTGTLNWVGGAGALFAIGNGNLTIKGLNLTNAPTVFSPTGSGVLTAYANNITAFTTAYGGGGTPAIGHNYWGTNNPAAAAPSGMPGTEWPKRLGAPVGTWADGATGSVGASLGGASLKGGSGGTVVVVSYGRGSLSNVPFGNGTAPYDTQTCSDYYDFFTVGGTGTFTATVPVDTSPATCSTNTLTPKKVFWVTNLATCSSSTPNSQCWNLISSGTSVVGPAIQITGLSSSNLGGTPFVAGDPTGLDPTAVTLVDFRAEATTAASPWGVVLVALVVLMSLGTLLWGLRRHTHA